MQCYTHRRSPQMQAFMARKVSWRHLVISCVCTSTGSPYKCIYVRGLALMLVYIYLSVFRRIKSSPSSTLPKKLTTTASRKCRYCGMKARPVSAHTQSLITLLTQITAVPLSGQAGRARRHLWTCNPDFNRTPGLRLPLPYTPPAALPCLPVADPRPSPELSAVALFAFEGPVSAPLPGASAHPPAMPHGPVIGDAISK
jgi:hypothetical protein